PGLPSPTKTAAHCAGAASVAASVAAAAVLAAAVARIARIEVGAGWRGQSPVCVLLLMYEALEALNGTHPWRDVGAGGYVDYRARRRDGGRVVYFNFELAAAVGIVPARPARRITARLERAILRSFSLVLIEV